MLVSWGYSQYIESKSHVPVTTNQLWNLREYDFASLHRTVLDIAM